MVGFRVVQPRTPHTSHTRHTRHTRPRHTRHTRDTSDTSDTRDTRDKRLGEPVRGGIRGSGPWDLGESARPRDPPVRAMALTMGPRRVCRAMGPSGGQGHGTSEALSEELSGPGRRIERAWQEESPGGGFYTPLLITTAGYWAWATCDIVIICFYGNIVGTIAQV